MNIQKFRFALDDGNSCFKVRRLDIRQKPPFKAGAQPVLQGFDFLGRPVRGQNNLLFCLIKGIKGMEKLLLGLILTADKLNVIY